MKLVGPRRHHRGRRLSLADPAPLCRHRSPPRCRACTSTSCSPSGGLADAQAFQGKDAILSGPAGGIVGMVRTARAGSAAGTQIASSASTWAAPPPTSATTPASSSAPSRPQVAGVRVRAPMMSDPHRGRRRRLDPRLRRRALPRRAAQRRRQSRPGLLPPRRPADRDRRQRAGRQDPARASSRACSGPPATSRSTARSSASASPRSPPRSSARPAARARPSRSPRASSTSPSATWPTRSRRSRSRAATTSPATRLQCFGGAGGQHACRVADALGMTRVFVHPLAGVLSAYGMGLADQATMRQAAIELPLDAAGAAPADAAGRARRRGRAPSSSARACRRRRSRSTRRVHVRYDGTDTALVVPFGDVAAMRAAFEAAYRQRFAFLDERAAADRRGGVGRGGRRRRRAAPRRATTLRRERRRAPVAGRACACSATAAGTTPPWSSATTPAPGQRHRRPGDRRRAQRHDHRRARLAGAGHRRSTTWCWSGSRRAPPRQRDRHHRRPGAARGVQPPVHEHRRADGAAAAEHRLLGEHQGAARLLLRPVRRRGQPDRQRAAHAGAPRLDERIDQDGDRAQRRERCSPATSTCSTIRTTAARTCPT